MLFWALLGVVAFATGWVEGAENVLGGCPTVGAMQQFNMSQFAGTWFVQDVFDRRMKCMQWQINPLPDNVWELVETKQSGLSQVFNGKIYPSDDGSGKLTVSWAANVGGRYPLTVFETDYNNHAGVFLCQKLWFSSRWNGMILSREPNLQRGKRQELKGTLAAYDIPMGYFHGVQQVQCGDPSDLPPLNALGPNSRGGGAEDFGDFGEQFGEERDGPR